MQFCIQRYNIPRLLRKRDRGDERGSPARHRGAASTDTCSFILDICPCLYGVLLHCKLRCRMTFHGVFFYQLDVEFVCSLANTSRVPGCGLEAVYSWSTHHPLTFTQTIGTSQWYDLGVRTPYIHCSRKSINIPRVFYPFGCTRHFIGPNGSAWEGGIILRAPPLLHANGGARNTKISRLGAP